MESLSIPFKITDTFEGLAECEGILRVYDETLTLEYQQKDAMLGVFKSGVKKVEVSMRDIEEVDFKKSIFGNTMTIRFATMQATGDLPRSDASEVKVSIARKYVDKALSFVSQLKLGVAEYRLREAQAWEKDA